MSAGKQCPVHLGRLTGKSGTRACALEEGHEGPHKQVDGGALWSPDGLTRLTEGEHPGPFWEQHTPKPTGGTP